MTATTATTPQAPLISAAELQQALPHPASVQGADVLVLDCSFDLTDAASGRRAHDAGHVPGAFHVSLDDTLSSAKTGKNGRHPLPTREAFAKAMAALGANDDSLIVAYDNAGGMYAARLWWMLRWAGHANVAVLDGGYAAWQAAGNAVSTTPSPAREPGSFTLRESLVGTVDYAQVLANIDSRERLVVDARAPDRYRGENETLDPIGGHIPGAANRLFRNNLGTDGRFKPAETLRAEWLALLGNTPINRVISQCGSGVTACHNLLALEAAGLSGAALYPGSWSEWSAQAGAPIATGAQP